MALQQETKETIIRYALEFLDSYFVNRKNPPHGDTVMTSRGMTKYMPEANSYFIWKVQLYLQNEGVIKSEENDTNTKLFTIYNERGRKLLKRLRANQKTS